MTIQEFGNLTWAQFHTSLANIPEIERLFAEKSKGSGSSTGSRRSSGAIDIMEERRKMEGKEPIDVTRPIQIPFIP